MPIVVVALLVAAGFGAEKLRERGAEERGHPKFPQVGAWKVIANGPGGQRWIAWDAKDEADARAVQQEFSARYPGTRFSVEWVPQAAAA